MSATHPDTLPDGTAVLWSPHAGPQTRFLASSAYEALYGGAAGGGKTDALLYGLLRQVYHPQYRALFLRRTFPELREVIDRSLAAFRQLGAEWRESEKRWRFPSGATIEFGYCEAYKDVLRYQGQEFTAIAFDELGQCPEERIWTYLMSRNRTTAPDLVVQMRASANPGGPGHAWLKRRYVDACGVGGGTYVDRATGLLRAYVPSRVWDNPSLGPDYVAKLQALPEVTRRQLLDGDWNAGTGLALEELDETRHVITPAPARIPSHWTLFGAFDWGYQHPFSFGLFGADERGSVTLIDSVRGRRLQPPLILERIRDGLARWGLPVERLPVTYAGHDCWHDVRARGESGPTMAEAFGQGGLTLVRATISRVSGLNNLRRYLAWRGPKGEEREPAFTVWDTPNNRQVFDTLAAMVVDPDHVEDVLKVDADPDSGEFGDDAYDMVRYGLMSRPLVARAPAAPRSTYDVEHRHPGYAREDGRLVPGRPASSPATPTRGPIARTPAPTWSPAWHGTPSRGR